ncbi:MULTISPECIES: phage tail protein [unclassified Pseudomonas]|uniref:phage tail protein n=1 Tax=unclassified Pseudomonas TaxID=196821 RepID=UPI0009981A14|nr:tail fiber protein [Pseudomonas sp. MF4836]OOW00854.1 phage tail protein [Pseudomonas sp. MF4836]
MDAFTGEIRLFPYNFAPQNWAYCDGSLLLTQQYPALFSIIGNLYGGNPARDFNLPNLNGRVAMGAGNGVGLTNRTVGNATGADQVTILPANFAGHSHAVQARDGSDNATAQDEPSGSAYLAQPRNVRLYNAIAPTASSPSLDPYTLPPVGTSAAAGGTPRNTLQPFQTLAYCICLDGEYPIKP